MTLELEFSWLIGTSITLMIFVIGTVGGVVKLLLAQAQKRQDEKHTQVMERLGGIEKAHRDEAAQWQRVERDLLQLKADMPLNYVRREDYIRGQSVVESKLDSIASELKLAQLRRTIGVRDAD